MIGKTKGFTLIELMVVVAIIAILAALAYYNYGRYGFRARRVDGKQYLTAIAVAQERYYTNYNVYAANVTGVPPAGLNFAAATSPSGYYTVAIALGAANATYTLTATPAGGQVGDACANLTLDNSGNKGQSGNTSNGACW